MSIRPVIAPLLALLMSAVVPASQQAPAPAPGGLILGTVVDATSGAPIAGVVVSIANAQAAAPAASRIAEPRVLTDAQGRFLFRGVPAGSYLLQTAVGGSNAFSPSGFVVTGMGFPIGAYVAGGYGQRRVNGLLQALDLAENQRIGDVVIRMWKCGVISGRLLDEAGEPLVYQVVGAAQVSTDARLLTGPTVRTDDRGMYRLAALPPGQWIVVVPQTQVSMPVSIGEELAAGPPDPTVGQRFSQANAPPPRAGGVRIGSSVVSTTPDPVRFTAEALVSNALAPVRRADGFAVYPTTFFPSATRVAQATRIVLKAGEDRSGTDIRLVPVATGSVSGVLVDDAGPVPNIGLHLMPADMGPDASILEAASTSSDSRGAFSFPVVPAGQYTILVWRVGGVPTGDPQKPFADARRVGDMSDAWARQTVNVVAGRAATNVSVTMHAPVTVSGHVAFEGSNARPGANSGRPFLTIYPTSPLFRTPGPSSGSAIDFANDGRFAIRGVSPPGRFVFGLPSMPSPWTLQSVTIGGRDVTDAALDVTDADLSDAVITFTDRPASLSGTVALPAGDDAMAVFLFPASKTRWADARSSARTFRTVRPSKSGAFSFGTVLPGEYLIATVADESAGDWPDEAFLAKLAAVATPVRVLPNQSATAVLKPSVIK